MDLTKCLISKKTKQNCLKFKVVHWQLHKLQICQENKRTDWQAGTVAAIEIVIAAICRKNRKKHLKLFVKNEHSNTIDDAKHTLGRKMPTRKETFCKLYVLRFDIFIFSFNLPHLLSVFTSIYLFLFILFLIRTSSQRTTPKRHCTVYRN